MTHLRRTGQASYSVTIAAACFRLDDEPCNDPSKGWREVDPGAKLGGCRMVFESKLRLSRQEELNLIEPLEEGMNGFEMCTHPSERFDHATALFEDGYGGFISSSA